MKTIIIAIAAACLLSACNYTAGWHGTNPDSTNNIADSGSYAAFARDESITTANAYSDLFLDSNKIESFIQQQKLPDSNATALRNFYRVRNYQYAWFASDGATEQARGLWSLFASDKSVEKNDSLKTLRDNMDSLLQTDSVTLEQNDSSLLGSELQLTQQLMQYSSSHPEHISRNEVYYMVPAKKMDAMAFADSLLKNKNDSSLHAGRKDYTLLKQQLQEYYTIAKNGGWDSVKSKQLRKGTTSPEVIVLKKRLSQTKDYPAAIDGATNIFDDSLAMAVKNFQQRNGLKPTGVVNDSMINILNVPVEERIKQILVNMNRLLWMPPKTDSARIEVDIPSQMLYAYSDSGKALEMPVIVGKEGSGTVLFSSKINEIVFNPTWTIPESIVRDEILPKMKADATYLKKHNMEVVHEGTIPELKQLPGKDNPLGHVKFLFPNTHDIYLHDTPDKGLFQSKDRTFSHGCIRVANATALATFLLRDQKEWTEQKIKAAMNSGKEQTVKLINEQPVSITYMTTWVDGNARIGFRNDVYGHDKDAIRKMFV